MGILRRDVAAEGRKQAADLRFVQLRIRCIRQTPDGGVCRAVAFGVGRTVGLCGFRNRRQGERLVSAGKGNGFDGRTGQPRRVEGAEQLSAAQSKAGRLGRRHRIQGIVPGLFQVDIPRGGILCPKGEGVRLPCRCDRDGQALVREAVVLAGLFGQLTFGADRAVTIVLQAVASR